MKKRREKNNLIKVTVITIVVVFVFLFLIVPLFLALFDGEKIGNVALIPVEGIIMASGTSNVFGESVVASDTIVKFIEEAAESSQIEAIVLEINSPGGSPVASDEIGTAIKNAKDSGKPVVAVIREIGASGGYWIASATDYIIANRMSATGSIGVISSYVEFSGLMEEYGVGYEQLTAGKYKDIGTPFRQLKEEERDLFQNKINKIYDIFVDEVALNRNIPREKVVDLATGEVYFGMEALNLGLIDQLGDKATAEKYLKEEHDLQDVDYVVYQRQLGLLNMLSGIFSGFFYHIGEGFGSMLLKKDGRNSNLLI